MGPFYIEYEYWFAAIQLILAMLGMGATLSIADFARILRTPFAAIVGIVMQLLLVPVMALGFISLPSVAGPVVIGIALLAALPGGTTSNIFTHFARGNSALSICITAVTTLACLITTPLILGFLVAGHIPADFVMPVGRIASEIGLTLLLPLALGMLVLQFKPNSAALFSSWCIRLSLLFIVFIVIGSSSAGRLDVDAFGNDNVFTVMLFMMLIAAGSMLIPRLLGMKSADCSAIEIEVTVRNVNLGVLINASLFPASDPALAETGSIVLLTVLLYGGVQLLLGAALIGLGRLKNDIN